MDNSQSALDTFVSLKNIKKLKHLLKTRLSIILGACFNQLVSLIVENEFNKIINYYLQNISNTTDIIKLNKEFLYGATKILTVVLKDNLNETSQQQQSQYIVCYDTNIAPRHNRNASTNDILNQWSNAPRNFNYDELNDNHCKKSTHKIIFSDSHKNPESNNIHYKKFHHDISKYNTTTTPTNFDISANYDGNQSYNSYINKELRKYMQKGNYSDSPNGISRYESRLYKKNNDKDLYKSFESVKSLNSNPRKVGDMSNIKKIIANKYL